MRKREETKPTPAEIEKSIKELEKAFFDFTGGIIGVNYDNSNQKAK